MEPGFTPGDHLLFSSYPYGFRLGLGTSRYFTTGTPQRGDLVLARTSYDADTPRWFSAFDVLLRTISFQRLNLESILGEGRGDSWLVRRVVGLPGDTLYIENGWCFVKPSGGVSFRREDALSPRKYEIVPPPGVPGWLNSLPGPSSAPLTQLMSDEYFLLTDNRMALDDSRLWGPVPRQGLVARLLIRYWPLGNQTGEKND